MCLLCIVKVSVGFQNKLATVKRLEVRELETFASKKPDIKELLGEDRCQDRVDYRLVRPVYS